MPALLENLKSSKACWTQGGREASKRYKIQLKSLANFKIVTKSEVAKFNVSGFKFFPCSYMQLIFYLLYKVITNKSKFSISNYLKKPRSFVTNGSNPIIRAVLIVLAM